MFGRKPEVVIVGCGPLARETARDLSKRALVVGAFALKRESARPDLGVPLLGRSEELGAYLALNPVDEVFG